MFDMILMCFSMGVEEVGPLIGRIGWLVIGLIRVYCESM